MPGRRRRTIRRLVVGYIVAFGMITLASAAATYLFARHELARQLDAHIASRMALAERKWRSDGLSGMDHWLDTMNRRGGHFSYVVTAPGGRQLRSVEGIGPLTEGWGMARFDDLDDDSIDPARTLTRNFADGSSLTIVADRDYIEQFDTIMIGFLAFAVPLLLATAAIGGLSLDANVRRRLRDVNATAAAIMDGDLQQRIPVTDVGDEFDRLSATLNRMFDRIGALLSEVRRATIYVAHDLRTPLVAIADDLRTARDHCDVGSACAATLNRAAESTDRLIDLFGIILEIGEINSVRVRESGKLFDLSDLVETLAGAHVEVAEDGGRKLTCSVQPGISLFGVNDLLAQALINLIQNALTHTPPGTQIHVTLETAGNAARLCVADDGPGLPYGDVHAILSDERPSESSAGSRRAAIGIKLVQAIAAAHQGRLTIEDAEPGLRAILELPLRQRSH